MTWDSFYLKMAKLVASKSKDPSTQVGSVIVDSRRRVVSLGYNGFASGVDDLPERLNSRDIKYKMVIHAEENAMLFGDKLRMESGTIYTWPFQPCSNCAAKIIQSGIQRVVSIDAKNHRWEDAWTLTKQQFEEAGVNLTLYDQDYMEMK